MKLQVLSARFDLEEAVIKCVVNRPDLAHVIEDLQKIEAITRGMWVKSVTVVMDTPDQFTSKS